MTIILTKAANPNISKQAQELTRLRETADETLVQIKRIVEATAAAIGEKPEDLDNR